MALNLYNGSPDSTVIARHKVPWQSRGWGYCYAVKCFANAKREILANTKVKLLRSEILACTKVKVKNYFHHNVSHRETFHSMIVVFHAEGISLATQWQISFLPDCHVAPFNDGKTAIKKQGTKSHQSSLRRAKRCGNPGKMKFTTAWQVKCLRREILLS